MTASAAETVVKIFVRFTDEQKNTPLSWN